MGEFGPRPPAIDETFVLERAVLAASAGAVLAASAGEEASPANTAQNLLRAVLAGEAMRLRLAGQLTGGTAAHSNLTRTLTLTQTRIRTLPLPLTPTPTPTHTPTPNPNPNPGPSPTPHPPPDQARRRT